MLSKQERAIVLFLWATAKPHTLEEAENDSFYPQWLKYDYDIIDPQQTHDQLLSEGYYQPALPDEILTTMTSAQLKSLAGTLGLKKTGSKNDIAARITANATENQVSAALSETYYTLSDQALALLKDNNIVISLHQNPSWGVSYSDFQNVRSSVPLNFGDRDVLWRLLNERIGRALPSGELFQIRQDYHTLGDISLKYDGNEKTAVSFWLTSLFFDLSSQLLEPLRCRSIGISYEPDLKQIKTDIYLYPGQVDLIRKHREIIPDIPVTKIIKPSFAHPIYSEADYQAILDALSSAETFDNDKWNIFCAERTIEWVKHNFKVGGR